MSSIDESGYPWTRALLPFCEREWIKTFYFTTNTSSNKVKHFTKNSRASLYFFDKLRFKGLMVLWEAEVLTDTETKNRIWRVGDEMYYSKWVTDEDYAVVKFNAKKFRFYENFGNEEYVVS
jgi:general stress protein 26